MGETLSLLKQSSLHTCHRQIDVKWQLELMKTDLPVIPGEMTNVLQPVDISINKSIKWNQLLVEGAQVTHSDRTYLLISAFHYMDMDIGSLAEHP